MGSKQTQILRLGGVVMGRSPGDTPDGSLHLGSQNVVLWDDGRVRSRSGVKKLMGSTVYDKIFAYDDYLYLHASGGTFARVVLGTPYTATSIGSAPSPSSSRKPQAVQAGGRLFVTTSNGVRVLDTGSGVLRGAGGLIAPGFTSAAVTATSGWLDIDASVAYRYTLGLETSEGVQILGAPSPRQIVSNAAGAAAYTVNLVARLSITAAQLAAFGLEPEQLFVQIWRSRQVTIGDEPDDDLRLVFERRLTSLEVTNGVTGTIEDVVPGDPPDDLRGEYLYTNPNSGEGIAQANYPPPCAELAATHKNRLWLGHTFQPQELFLKIIAVGTANGLQNLDVLLIPELGLSYEAGADFTVTTTGSASENIRATTESLVRAINTDPANTAIWAEVTSSPDDPLGEIRLFGRDPTQPNFSLFTSQRSDGSSWSPPTAFAPDVPPQLMGPALALTYTIQRVANVVTATISSGNITRALRVGDRVLIAGGVDPSPTFGLGPHVVTSIAGASFTYAETGVNAGPTAGVGFAVPTEGWLTSAQERKANRLHYSKPDEFEAFPLGNYIDVGAASEEIRGLVATRDTLWIFKKDGLFRLTGDDEATFELERMDSTIELVSTECLRPFAESVVAWTTKGVVMLSESSFDIISADVDEVLRRWLLDDTARAASLRDQCFMVVDERDQVLRLHIAGSSEGIYGFATDGAGEALTYSVRTKTWSRWVWPHDLDAGGTAPRPFLHGLMNPADRCVYYFDAADDSGIEGSLLRELRPTEASAWRDEVHLGDKQAIRRVALWNYATEKAPMRDKRFDEVTVLLENALNAGTVGTPTPFSFGFANELSGYAGQLAYFFGVAQAYPLPVQSGTATPVSVATRISVPFQYARGQRLWILVENSALDADFILDGYAILGEVLNQAIVR